jgi:hypothetical protein
MPKKNVLRSEFRRPRCGKCDTPKVETTSGAPGTKYFYVWCGKCKVKTRCVELTKEQMR